jgi:hypothetical protein
MLFVYMGTFSQIDDVKLLFFVLKEICLTEFNISLSGEIYIKPGRNLPNLYKGSNVFLK